MKSKRVTVEFQSLRAIAKSKIRNAKFEANSKYEIRIAKHLRRLPATRFVLNFCPSNLFRASEFGLRILVFLTLFVSATPSVSQKKGDVFVFSKPLLGIYIREGDTEKRIVCRYGPYMAPKLSPDKDKILFHSKEGGRIGLWLTDLKSEKKERLCDGEQADWSPDGTRIIFQRQGRIMEREIASGRERVITPPSWLSCQFPSYLPDGRVLFVLKGKGKDKIFLIDPDKKIAPELLVQGEINSTPKGSPDGKRIAYQDGAHIYLMELSKRKISQLTIAGGVQSYPIWSSDSRSLCYCQSPEASGGPWDIYNVKIDSPQNTSLVTRDVSISPDWRGSSPSTSATVELEGDSINLWQIEKSLWEKGSWRALPRDANYIVRTNLAVENDWCIFYLSPKENKIVILPKERGSFQREERLGKDIELIMINKEGKRPSKIDSIRLLGNDKEKVVLLVSFRSKEGDVTKAIFTVPKSRPIVEIRPIENINRVYFKRNFNLALLPDRFADDLIFHPRKNSAAKVSLPYAPFLIGLLPEGGMVLFIASSDKQRIFLIRGEEEHFKGIEMLTGNESVFISFLSRKDLWYKTQVVPNPNIPKWKVDWSNPFSAQWRMAMLGEGKHYSRMWDEEALNKLEEPFLPLEADFSEAPEISVIYLYGRSWNTPLSVITPMDILQDALGIENLEEALDIEGLRTFRTAEEKVPLHELLTSQDNRIWPQDSPGWPEVLDFSPIFQLLGRIRMVERKGVISTVTHLCEDILNSLKGLDDRAQEYEKFLVSLEYLCEVNKKRSLEANKFLATVEENIKGLRTKIANLPITEIEKVSDSIEGIKGCLGTATGLLYRSEYKAFQEVSKSALSERQEILTKYRDFVKRVRNEAGIIVTRQPTLKDIAEQIRQLTQNVLRKRYYLEGDWRGEKPLK